jgi:hypothetical protein
MKFKNKIFLLPALLIVVAAGFPAAVKATCSCTCQPVTTEFTNPGSTTVVSKLNCAKATSEVILPEQADLPACTAACKALPAPDGIGTPPCYNSAGGGTCSSGSTAACWCDAGSGAYKKSDTASQTDCQKTCTDLTQKFVAWSNAGPTQPISGNDIKCPPGGDWTQSTCLAATNSEGAKIGRWNPPAGQEKGPYCFYNDIPIKLGVGLGTLTQANLSQYLAAAYNLALGFAAVLAVIFIMIGGFRYIAAAGGAEVEQGKSMIKNAVIGLVLAALSYTLLLTVNPDILSLRLPSIQLIKQCDVKSVDCGSRDQTICENNTADSSKRCSWNGKLSICQDLSITQSGTAGQVGGPCKVDASGNKTCDVGDCVVISSNEAKCSQFAKCQACQNDTTYDSSGGIADRLKQQCQPSQPSGLPIKCIDHMCADINPNNPPKAGSATSNDNYVLCTNSSGCSSDTQCATGKCGAKHTCIASGQGTDCLANGQDDCKTGYTCVPWKKPNGDPWKAACCKDGNVDGCFGGCGSDGDCIEMMFCMDQTRFNGFQRANSSLDPNLQGRCINDEGSGLPCNSNSMCVSGVCTGGLCK